MLRDESRTVELNADMGEGFGVYAYGADAALLPLVDSANVACGFHASDPVTMQRSVDAALERGVRIGAHVGLPDRLGFGRRRMEISADDAYAYTLYQVGALDAFVTARGGRLSHVKPHGALYMDACADPRLAEPLADAVLHHDDALAVYTLPGSALARAAHRRGLRVVPEFFADRPYVDGEVRMFGWTPHEVGGPTGAAARTTAMLHDPLFDDVRTVCVHSDTPDAPAITAAVRTALAAAGVLVPVRHPSPTR